MNRNKPNLGALLFRSGIMKVEDGETRSATFIASSEDTDRYGDIIRADGWELDNFKKNPVLLFGHNSRDLPIGKVSNIAVNASKQLIADVEFAAKEVSEFADSVYKMVKAGFLNAVSVGFKPTKMPNEIKDPATNAWTGGFEFIGQELLELSVVPVPALPGALAIARSLSVDERHVLRVMPDVLNVDNGASAFHAARQRQIAMLRSTYI